MAPSLVQRTAERPYWPLFRAIIRFDRPPIPSAWCPSSRCPAHGSVLAFRQTSPGPPGVGSTLEGRFVILGLEMRFKTRITQWHLPHGPVTFSSEGGPFRSIVLRLTLDATTDGTRMTESREMELRPALRLLRPLVVPFWRRRTRTAQKNFKRLVEGQPENDAVATVHEPPKSGRGEGYFVERPVRGDSHP